jgi:hypothetical protein
MPSSASSLSSSDTSEAEYRQRARPFGSEISFRLDQDALTIDNGRKVEVWPYREIAALRLTYEPKSVVWHAFRIKLSDQKGRTVSITNLNWASYVQVHRQDADYTRFVCELVARIRKANPRLIALAGKPPLLYYATVLFAGLSGVLLLATSVMAALRGAWLAASLALLFVLPFAKMSQQLITRNRPDDVSGQPLPARLLPDVSPNNDG